MLRHKGIFSLLVVILMSGVIAPPATAEPGTRTIYLVRHGFYDYHDEQDAEVGKALVPLGVAQARLVADRLRSIPVTYATLYSSTMTRARQTAYIVRDELGFEEVLESPLLSECTPPTWREDIMAEYGGPEMDECTSTLDAAFEHFFLPSTTEDNMHEILVCHGNVTRYFVTKVLKVDTLSWLMMSVGNCSLTTIRVNSDGTMKLLGVGDMGHIPPPLQSGVSSDEPLLLIPEK